ncbi:MAG: BlaI/MecI/CopY family transcriptional regulator [Clostridiales bacterium]|jgi:predicted transcriptional regulator|nr:BlaI/MecI/CopY family transcriptional regulator [Clostridiales bacterium]
MSVKLFDSELKVMDVLWKEGDMPAKKIVEALSRGVGWHKNTTYTIIRKCIEKGAVIRIEPNFICTAALSKEQVQEYEVNELIGKLFDGSADMLFASLLGRKSLPAHVISRLKKAAQMHKEESS